jgi:signal transduction histidine kinase
MVRPVEREGDRLAILVHSAPIEERAFEAAFGPSTLIALDNERLRAARLARLADLQASRARIVAVGDATRRKLERDLHDGAQQGLLSVLFDLRLARLGAERSGDAPDAGTLATAESAAQDAVDELRRIAHGVHPAVLTRSGLGAALASLADEALVSLEVDVTGLDRLPESVEATAYQVVVEHLEIATAHGAGRMTVHAATEGARLMLEIADDAAAVPDAVPVHIADRVGAAGGLATVERLPSGGTMLRVELPCA